MLAIELKESNVCARLMVRGMQSIPECTLNFAFPTPFVKQTSNCHSDLVKSILSSGLNKEAYMYVCA